MRCRAATLGRPSRKPEFTATPSPVKAAVRTSPPFTTSTIGRPKRLANSVALSWAGTAMIAPVP
jgi:hypothetical protein